MKRNEEHLTQTHSASSDAGYPRTPTSDVQQQFGNELADQVAERLVRQLGPSLESMTPEEAVNKYFDTRDLKQSTEDTHKSSLYNHFVYWCENVGGIDDMNSLTGNDLADYRVWRRDEASDRVDKLSPKSEETQQKITRTFIEYCESWEVVRPSLHEYVLVPNVDKEDAVRDEVLDSGTAKDILEWLNKYEYGSLQHVVVLLFAACGARTGGVHSLDRDDYTSESDGGYLKFQHRPESGTTLKNGKDGNREVEISDSVCDVLDDYLKDHRKAHTDEHGREPLLTTSHGRLATSTIRNYIYAWTRPCAIGRKCPYEKNPDECEARRNNWAFKCPDSLSCHPVRKGYITAELKAGVPKAVVSERCDVSEAIMDKHYDFRTEAEKRKARRVARRLAHTSESTYGE
jgi:integrase